MPTGTTLAERAGIFGKGIFWDLATIAIYILLWACFRKRSARVQFVAGIVATLAIMFVYPWIGLGYPELPVLMNSIWLTEAFPVNSKGLLKKNWVKLLIAILYGLVLLFISFVVANLFDNGVLSRVAMQVR